jgi:hypothetical protein
VNEFLKALAALLRLAKLTIKPGHKVAPIPAPAKPPVELP